MFNLEDLHLLFPPECQQRYVRHITCQRDLSPIQAEYFVKLWAYACLCRNGAPYEPIQTLDNNLYDFPFPLSHEDARKLFYSDKKTQHKKKPGTSRAAGLMLKNFASDEKGNLIRYQLFKGTKTEIRLNIPIEFNLPDNNSVGRVYPDEFSCRKDLLPVRLFLKELYSINTQISERELESNITRGLRNWSDQEAIGFMTIMPVSPKSEDNFFANPHESLHLSQFSLRDEDPIQIAAEDELDCYMAYIRSWQIQPGLWTYDHVLALLEETKKTLQAIHADYPELSEVYSMTIHPRLEAFARLLGFRTTSLVSNAPLRWLCIHLDAFLALDFKLVLENFSFDQ